MVRGHRSLSINFLICDYLLFSEYTLLNYIFILREALVATHDATLLEKLSCTIHLMKTGSIVQSTTSEELHSNSHNALLIKNFIAGTPDIIEAN
jgi:ABC-type dipeptide/oligopeptide/nickel transport system ATPase subunit